MIDIDPPSNPPVGLLTDGEIAYLRAWAEDYAAVEVAKARSDELERCAKLCANLVAPFGLSDSQRSVYDTATIDCEAAIRGVYPHRLASRPI